MKYVLSFFLCSVFWASSAQNASTTIVYEKTYEINGGGLNKRQLILKSDGTFEFHRYRKIKADAPEENVYGKGVWTTKKDLYIFSAKPNIDVDEKYTLDFDTSKARVFKDGSIKFLNSKVSWVKGMPLDKVK